MDLGNSAPGDCIMPHHVHLRGEQVWYQESAETQMPYLKREQARGDEPVAMQAGD